MRQFIMEFLLVAFPKALNGLGLILINFMAMKALDPAQFGIFSLCSVAILLFDGIVGSAFDMAILRLVPALRTLDPPRSHSLETAALLLKLIATALLGSLALLLAQPLSRFAFENSRGGIYILLTVVAAIAMLGLRSVQLHLQVDQRFGLYGSFDLLTSLLRLSGVFSVLTVLPNPSPAPLLMVLAAAPAIVFVTGLSTVASRLLRPNGSLMSAGGELLGFTQWSLPTLALTTLASRLDLFALTSLREVEELGIYSAAQTLTSIPELLGMYLAVVLGPRIVPAIQAGQFHRLFARSQTALALFALLGLLGALLGFGLLRQFLPPRYERSLPIVGLLLPGSLAAMVNFPIVVSFLMFFRPSFLSKVELIILPLAAVMYYFAVRHYGIMGAAAVTTGLRLLKAAIHLGFAWHWAPVSHHLLQEIGETNSKP